MSAAPSPWELALAAAVGGYPSPEPSAPRHCAQLTCRHWPELIALAAATPACAHVAIDHDAGRVDRARRAAESAGLDNLTVHLGPLASIGALGPAAFDVVDLADMYCHIDEEARAALLSWLGRFVRPGGLVHVETAVLPGAAILDPVWALGRDLATDAADPLALVDQALGWLDELIRGGAIYAERTPELRDRVTELRRRHPFDRRGLAETLFGPHRRPVDFPTLAAELGCAGLVHAGPVLAQRDRLPDALCARLEPLAPATRELAADYFLDRRVRRDVFVRAEARDLPAAARLVETATWVRQDPDGASREGTLQALGMTVDELLEDIAAGRCFARGCEEAARANREFARAANERLLACAVDGEIPRVPLASPVTAGVPLRLEGGDVPRLAAAFAGTPDPDTSPEGARFAGRTMPLLGALGVL